MIIAEVCIVLCSFNKQYNGYNLKVTLVNFIDIYSFSPSPVGSPILMHAVDRDYLQLHGSAAHN